MAVPVSINSTTSPERTGEDQRVLDRLRTYVTMISPTRAQEILTSQNYSRQRDIRPTHVAYLLEAIRRHELTELSIVFAEGLKGGKVLVDGQHRLTALVQADVTLPATVTVHRVLDDHDLSRLYAKIDRQSTRTPQTILRAFGIEERTSLNRKEIQYLAQAVSLVSHDFTRDFRARTRSLITRAELTEQWLPYGEQYGRFLEGTANEVTQMLWRAAVAAVALATIKYQPDYAERFWRELALEDGLPRNDPRAKLLAWLRAHRVQSVKGDINYARHVAGAWNAFFEGRTLERLMLRDLSSPVRILGTPYGRESAR